MCGIMETIGGINMKKGFDILISLILNICLFLVWVVEMILTGDAPVIFENSEARGIIIALFIFTVIYSLYLIKSKCNILNLVQSSMFLFLWGMGLLQELKYSYHPNNRLVNTIAFVLSLLLVIQIIFKIVKNNKLKKLALS